MFNRARYEREKRKAERRRNVAAFADLLAEGRGITEAAAYLGLSQQTGSAYFATIRKELGWQAQ